MMFYYNYTHFMMSDVRVHVPVKDIYTDTETETETETGTGTHLLIHVSDTDTDTIQLYIL